MRTRLLALAAALGVAATLHSGLAAAKPQFVRDIATHLSLGYQPPCGLCHVHESTGAATVHTPFALSMRANGFSGAKGSGAGSTAASLDALAAGQVDSDGDGATDVTELRAGSDPNDPVPGAGFGDTAYGCGARVAPRDVGTRAGAWLGVALAALAAARRVRVRNPRAAP